MSSQVRDMFASIAARYDVTNDVLSLASHRLWRKAALNFAGLDLHGKTVLDLCSGTGDFALLLRTKVGPSGRVIGADFARPMLSLAVKKRDRSANTGCTSFVCADGLSLPFADKIFHVVTIAFGIRNVDSVERCLAEIKRVLAPGGTTVILEFGKPRVTPVAAVFDLYSRWVMPGLGGLLTGNRAAYEYLPRTSRAFPAGAEFLKLFEAHGFTQTKMKTLFGGIAYIYTGTNLN